MSVYHCPYDGGKLERFVEALTFKRYLRARLNSKKAPEFLIEGKAFYGDPSSRPDLLPLRHGQDWDPYLGSLSGKSLGAEARRRIVEDQYLQALFMFIEADDDPDRAWLEWFGRAERRPRTTLREARQEGRRVLAMMQEAQEGLVELDAYEIDDPYEMS